MLFSLNIIFIKVNTSKKIRDVDLLTVFLFSLPSLRPMLDVNYLPLTDMRIARTFCFTNEGQALYLVSPTEIQRLTYSQEMCDNIQVGKVP